jgi:hypothetical protein
VVAFPGIPQWLLDPTFRDLRFGPLTVAGPRRIHTGFRMAHPLFNCEPIMFVKRSRVKDGELSTPFRSVPLQLPSRTRATGPSTPGTP